jgi:cation diffusion facilitator CzcD-associated flavoprotein CzcO
VPREERLAKWEQLYGEPGFGIWLANFRDTFMDEEANAELSAFIADKIRSRVHDPVLAEKLIPKDHGFGVQRVPMETRYYEAYNRDNVHLVDLQETPIERITRRGIQTTDAEIELDIIVYATGFDAVTGRLRSHRHPRSRWPVAAGEVGRRSEDVLRHAGVRLPQPLHADRARRAGRRRRTIPRGSRSGWTGAPT